ncbi:MarR family winged helix-turn-helix transcriptional regulator [Poseidonibacter antarcticus]|uniref:MarR family winged helix-turn-helix transcriptional regulator n=1 Tax=Poseidonibacter antarcticus TaxID=2478538 RepID=UPI001D190D8B|nr:MarR family transcriptional regulator [Poseidonibacter antarcticus]
MNIKQFKTNLEHVKKLSPEVFKKSMYSSVPFFILHEEIYEKGEKLLSMKFNINQSELDVLASLYYMGGEDYMLSPTKLYEVMIFSSGGMTKLLKKLEALNFIRRIENTNDKRSKLVQITDLGKQITTNALKDLIALEDTYFSKLNIKEQDTFQKLICKILN